jgi:hypothetical protein
VTVSDSHYGHWRLLTGNRLYFDPLANEWGQLFGQGLRWKTERASRMSD